MDSYQLILDTSNTFNEDPARGHYAFNPDSLERMLQAASYSAQMLDSAAKRAAEAPPVPPPTEEQPLPPAPVQTQEGDVSGGKARQVRLPSILLEIW